MSRAALQSTVRRYLIDIWLYCREGGLTGEPPRVLGGHEKRMERRRADTVARKAKGKGKNDADTGLPMKPSAGHAHDLAGGGGGLRLRLFPHPLAEPVPFESAEIASGVAVAQLGGGLKTSYAFLDVHGAPASIGVQFPKAVVDDAHKLVRVRACFAVIGLFPVVCLIKAVQQDKGFPIVLLDTEAAQVAVS